jgi:cytosine/adenosine deaminase-related metal-dependent hydrolase
MRTRYRAAWVLPISRPPIRDGWLDIEGDRILACGGGEPPAAPSDRAGGHNRNDVDLGEVALMPGLVNAHTHLELSHLRHQVPAGDEFVSWIRHIMAARRLHPDPLAPGILQALDQAIREAVACGTALVGDISNTLATFGPLASSPLAGVVFNEVIRFRARDADVVVSDALRQIRELATGGLVRAALAAHAPYSVGPAVFRALRRANDESGGPCSVHLSESRAETEFIKSGTGLWRSLLEEIGSWDPSWAPPAATPVEYLEREGFLSDRVLAVHGVQMSMDDLQRLRSHDATLVTCPRSNQHTGAGAPPIASFYESGVRVAVGTDSLASCPDLNVFSELHAMRALAPSVPPAALLDSATRQGARALGFTSDFGSLEAGKRARVLAVAVPRRAADVEEWLVSGIQPDQLCWIP